jgi:hypothetical protein
MMCFSFPFSFSSAMLCYASTSDRSYASHMRDWEGWLIARLQDLQGDESGRGIEQW